MKYAYVYPLTVTLKRINGIFTPNDSVAFTVMLMGGTFNLFDG